VLALEFMAFCRSTASVVHPKPQGVASRLSNRFPPAPVEELVRILALGFIPVAAEA